MELKGLRTRILLLRKRKSTYLVIVIPALKIMEEWSTIAFTNKRSLTFLTIHSKKTLKKYFSRKKEKSNKNLKKINQFMIIPKDLHKLLLINTFLMLLRAVQKYQMKLATNLKRSFWYLGTMKTPFPFGHTNPLTEVITSSFTAVM